MFNQKDERHMESSRFAGDIESLKVNSTNSKLNDLLSDGRQWGRSSSRPLMTPDMIIGAPLWILKGEQPKGPAHPFRSADARRLGETVAERAKRHIQEWRAENPVQALDQQVWGISPEPDEQQAVLAQAKAKVRAAVEVFRQDPGWMSTLETALGSQWDPDQAQGLLQRLGSGRGMPPIEVVPDQDLKGMAAYGEGRIWLSEGLLTQSQTHPHLLTEVLLEELGHHLDSQLNQVDSPGDEGEIFSKLVRDGQITSAQLRELRQENDFSLVRQGDSAFLVENFGWSSIKDTVSKVKNRVSSTMSSGAKKVINAGSRVVGAAVNFASDVKGAASGLKSLYQDGLTQTTFAPKPQNPRRPKPPSSPSRNPRGSTPHGPSSAGNSQVSHTPSPSSGSLLRYKPGRSMPSGNAVETVQADLNRLGYSLKVDGKYGPQSKKQVMEFQRKHGLAEDGIVGPNTRLAMQKALSNSPKLIRTVKQDNIPDHYSYLTQKYLKLERNADNMGTSDYSATQVMREQAGKLRDQQVRQSVSQISDLLHTDKQKWYTPWATGDAEVTSAELEEVANILAGVDDKAYNAIFSRLTKAQKEKIDTVRSTGEYAEKREANGLFSAAVLGVAREADRKGNNIAETASKITETFQEGLDKGQRSLVNIAQSQADKLDGTFLEDHADIAVDVMDQYSQVSLGVTKAVTSTVSDVVGMAANPDDFIKDMNALGQAIIKNNPLDGLTAEEKEFYKNMGEAIIEPYKALAEEGRYGEIAGLGLGEVLTSLVGGAGVAAKAGKFPKLARLANQVNRLKPSNPFPRPNLPNLRNNLDSLTDRFSRNKSRNSSSQANTPVGTKNLDNGLPDQKSPIAETPSQPTTRDSAAPLSTIDSQKTPKLKSNNNTVGKSPIQKDIAPKPARWLSEDVSDMTRNKIINTPNTPLTKGGFRKKFMNEQLKIITNTDNHPLKFLVERKKNPKTGQWNEQWKSHKPLIKGEIEPGVYGSVDIDAYGVQAGHMKSDKALRANEPETLSIEGAYENQGDAWWGAEKPGLGGSIEKIAVDIGGVPVEIRTAKAYEELGWLPKGTVDNARRHFGYSGYTKK